ncbi:hypothetical protein DL93DRAFT_2084704 [Clavulina sp. PMI_390]|nr:hypothetical protein DL93DRAFT_2084704 [Clavulina sp. PMI_390]
MARRHPVVIDLTGSDDEGPYPKREQARISTATAIPTGFNLKPATDELKLAIRSANIGRLQGSVLSLCDKIPGATQLLSQMLLVPPARAPTAPIVVNALHGNKRRLVPRWATCINCELEFDVSDNDDDTACEYHRGHIDVDWSSGTWADWDEDCHGPMDTEENQDEYPDGFKWTCCDTTKGSMYCGYDRATGEEFERDGCRVGRHQTGAEGSKKRRIY